MKKQLLLYLLLFTVLATQAQIQHGGLPLGLPDTPLKSTRSSQTSVVEMPPFDFTTMVDTSENNFHKALQFAHPFEVDLSTSNSGQWQVLEDGSRVWQLTIRSNEAASINVIFDEFKLPKGGKVFIYNTAMTHIIGAFTEANNKASGILPTLPVMGSEIVVEYQEPKDPAFDAALKIGQVNHDYTGIFNRLKVGYFGDAESCEKDVTCYVDELYQKTRRSTIKIIIDGSELMTGTLINNTAQDGTPYVISAAHGYETDNYSADKTLFVFNYEVPLCFTDLEGTREQSIAGGTMLSYSPKVSNEALDFALVEMSVTPPTAYRAYYAGWSRSSISPTYTFCIHHPQGDVKKISFDDDALLKKTLNANSLIYYPSGHWNVQQWEVGVTEGGSSGSGLFNPQGQFIGGLSAGAASCSSPRNDYFYRFDLAWKAGTANDRQLAHWLDASGSDVQELGPYETTEVTKTSRITHVNDASDITVVTDQSTGNIAGNNTIGISRFVEKFENTSPKSLLGMYFIAAQGKPGSVVNTTVWTGTDQPETEVYSEPLLIKRWAYTSYIPEAGTLGGFYPKDSLSMQENFILFTTPLEITGNYFIGFEVDNSQQSQPFGMVLSHENSEDNAYYYDTQWHSYLDLADYNKATTLWIDPVVYATQSTSIQERKAENLTVYPNPVRDGELLKIRSEISNETTLGIYDVVGKEYAVQLVSQSNNESALDVSLLPQGVYILKVGTHQVLFQKLRY